METLARLRIPLATCSARQPNDAFGKTVAESGDLRTTYRFRGQQGFSTDQLTGDISEANQNYSPSLGRSLSLASRDGRGYTGGASFGVPPRLAGWQIRIKSLDLLGACSINHYAPLQFTFPVNALPDPKPEQVWQLIHTRYYILRQRTCKWQFLREAFTLDVFKYTVRGDVVQVDDARFIQPEVGGGFRDGCMFFEESVASVGFNPVDAAGRNATLPFGTYYDEKITGEMIQSATRRRLPSPPFHTTYISAPQVALSRVFSKLFRQVVSAIQLS